MKDRLFSLTLSITLHSFDLTCLGVTGNIRLPSHIQNNYKKTKESSMPCHEVPPKENTYNAGPHLDRVILDPVPCCEHDPSSVVTLWMIQALPPC